MRNQRVLHNYEFHSDSILTMTTNNSLTKILTGTKNGEIVLTDLNNSKYCKIDKIPNNEAVLSLALSFDNTQVFCSTKNEIKEYVSKIYFKVYISFNTFMACITIY